MPVALPAVYHCNFSEVAMGTALFPDFTLVGTGQTIPDAGEYKTLQPVPLPQNHELSLFFNVQLTTHFEGG